MRNFVVLAATVLCAFPVSAQACWPQGHKCVTDADCCKPLECIGASPYAECTPYNARTKADCEKAKDMKWDDAKKACVKE